MITGRVVNAENVMLNLRSMGIRVRDNLRAAVTRGSVMLTAYVKEAKLSGQVLKNRTGTLRRKINYVVRETPSSITGSVGVKLSYAPPHEFGFDGVVNVREHLRTVRMAWGRPISPVVATVSGHSRHMHLPERSFLRSSLRENATPLMNMLRTAVAEGIR